MKKIFFKVSMALLLSISVSSCNKITDFLDKPPGVNLDENKIFTSRQQVELYLATGYKYSIPSHIPHREADYLRGPAGTNPAPPQTIFSAATDESEATADFVSTHTWNIGAVNSTNIFSAEDFMYFSRFNGIRVANILLERIDELPASENAFKIQIKAEAKFLRAISNFEMFKRYGGFPIIEGRVDENVSLSIKRNSIEECVNFIIKDCNESIAGLEQLVGTFPLTSQTGRVNLSAVKALKSKTLLFAASPLFNTATPYLSMADPANNKLICYGNYDRERWKLAIDATLDAITTADGAGFRLLDDPAKRSPTIAAVTNGANVVGNYKESWELPDNAEMILSYKGHPNTSGRFAFPWQMTIPNLGSANNIPGFWSGTAVNHNFIKRYEVKATGLPMVWPSSGGDPDPLYVQLDNRFHQTVGYNKSRFWSNVTDLQLFENGLHNTPAGICKTGTWMKKLNPETLPNGNMVPIVSVFRYNELLLNYAEALIEYNNSQADLDLATVQLNKIRVRTGLIPFPMGLSQNVLREKLQNERAIELAFENYRFWDIRRWMIADQGEKAMTSPITGLQIKKIGTTLSFREIEVEKRFFSKRMYLHPFDRDELFRNPNLVQNPGY